MNRFLFLTIGIASVMGMVWGCSSGGGKGVQGAGGSTLTGPFIGSLFSGGRAGAKMSGNLQGDGTMDITILSAPFPQMQTKVASDGSFAQDATVQGYTVHCEGKVELQPGAQHKFVVSGTFTSSGVGSASSGTFVLRSLDWQLVDGLKDPLGTSSPDMPPRLAFASESLGFASWTSPTAATGPSGADTSTSPVWRTDDGGDTWHPAGSVSGSVSDMRFAGGKLWVSTSTGLWASLDQGQSFASVMRSAAEIQFDNSGFGVGTLLMDFFDANHGAILSLSTGKVWVTSDGAKTWIANALLSEPGSPFNDAGSVQMLSGTEAVALVPSIASQNPALFRTSDGGQTWLAKKYNARTYVDEAHGIGVLGPTGAGTAERFGVLDDIDIVMGTFSKSLGSVGGFIASEQSVIDYLKHTARPFVFSASLAPASVGAVKAALDVMAEEPERQQRLLRTARHLRDELQARGCHVLESETPIVPVVVENEIDLCRLCKAMLEDGIYVNPVLRPAATQNLLRISCTAAHTDAQVDRLVETIVRLARKLEIPLSEA